MALLCSVGCSGASPTPAMTEEAVLASDDSVFTHQEWEPVPVVPVPLGPYDMIGRAGRLVFAYGTLWVVDASGDPFVHLLSAKSGEHLRSLGRSGEGPGDFSGLSLIAVRPGHPAEGWALDGGLQRLTALSSTSDIPPRVVQPAIRGLREMAWLDSTSLLVLTTRDTAHLALLDTLGQVLLVGPGVLLGPDSIPRNLRLQQSALAKFCVRPDGSRFAVAYRFAGRLAFHDAALALVGTAEVPYPSDGQFIRSKQTGEWVERSRRLFYISCTASQDHLYVLFSGRLQDKAHSAIYGPGITSGTFVQVFNWDGALERVLRLTHEVISIAQDGDSLLYGSSPVTDTLFKYRIPPPIQGGVR